MEPLQAMLPNDHFLSDVVEKAIKRMNGQPELAWPGNPIEMSIKDPLQPHSSSVSSVIPAETMVTKAHKSRLPTVPHTIEYSIQLPGQDTLRVQQPQATKQRTTAPRTDRSTVPQTLVYSIQLPDSETAQSRSSKAAVKTKGTLPDESFGVLLAQVFFILSILSKDSEYLRLTAISHLHRFKSVGHGFSFIARKVPRNELFDNPGSYPN
ncbi:hypothetical protein CPB86DRAFT_784443, partial [Serendipita vermifera]